MWWPKGMFSVFTNWTMIQRFILLYRGCFFVVNIAFPFLWKGLRIKWWIFQIFTQRKQMLRLFKSCYHGIRWIQFAETIIWSSLFCGVKWSIMVSISSGDFHLHRRHHHRLIKLKLKIHWIFILIFCSMWTLSKQPSWDTKRNEILWKFTSRSIQSVP